MRQTTMHICEYFVIINYMPVGIGQPYIIRRYITIKLYIVQGQWEDSLGYTGPCNFRILYVSNRNRLNWAKQTPGIMR